MFQRIKFYLGVVTRYPALVYFAIFRMGDHSLRRLAEAEIDRLQATNPGYAPYRKSKLDTALRRMNEHWLQIVGLWLVLTTAAAAWPSLTNVQGPNAFDIMAADAPIDVSNFHSISTTIQATVLALIIPIAVVLHEFVLTGRRLTKHAISFFLKGSKVALITASSIAYLSWVALFEVVAAYLELELHWTAAGFETVWLVFNLLLIGDFMLRAYRMLNRSEFDAEVRRHLFIDLYPRELKNDLLGVSFLTLPGEDIERDMDDPGPVVSVWLYREGTVEVAYSSTSPKQLYDVDARLLRHLFKIWRHKNRSLSGTAGRRQAGARLSIVPHLGKQVDGSTPLLASRNARPFNALERWAARSAFRFQRPAPTERFDTKETLETLATNAVNDLEARDFDSFEEGVDSLVEIHGQLLALGEAVDDRGRAINYASLEKGLLSGRIFENWTRVYQKVFEAALQVIDSERRAFEEVSWVGGRLASCITQLPSKTSLDRAVSVEAQLQYKLTTWWEYHADVQGLPRSVEAPSILKAPVSDTYQRCLRAFAGAWDTMLTEQLVGGLAPQATWSECRLFYPALLEHVTSTANFITRCCLAGDKEGALFWAAEFQRWRAAVKDMARDSHTVWNLRQSAVLSVSLLDLDWNAVKALLRDHEDFDQEIHEREVFKAVLVNLGIDLSLVLTAFMLHWDGGKGPEPTLAMLCAQAIFNGVSDDEGDIPRTKLLTSIHGYLLYLMRTEITRPAKSSYSAVIDRFADRINSWTKAEMISGRVYSFSGTSEEIVRNEILLLAAVVAPEEDAIDGVVKKYVPLFDDHRTSGRAKHTAAQTVERLKAFNDGKHSKALMALTGEQPEDGAATDVLAQRIEKLRLLFARLTLVADNAQDERVRALNISDKRLNEFAAAMSERGGFRKESGRFPVSLFRNVEWSPTALDTVTYRFDGVPKTEVVDAPDVATTNLKTMMSDAIREQVGPRVAFDILESAREAGQIEVIEYDSEQAFAEAFLRLTSKGGAAVNALIMMSRSRHPDFMGQWERATWLRDIVLPHRITVKRADPGEREGYSFSVNNTPVYEVGIDTRDVFIFSRQALKKLEFREFENQLPVIVSFEADAADPSRGSLLANWQRRVTLDPGFKVYQFSSKASS